MFLVGIIALLLGFCWEGGAQCLQDKSCCASSCDQCCSGKNHTDAIKCNQILICPICQKVVNLVEVLIKKVGIKAGCAALDIDGVAACEAIGLGPEDPLADICATAVVAACPFVLSLLTDKLNVDPEKVCELIHLCGGSGSGLVCGCHLDGHCTESSADCCSGTSHRNFLCPPKFLKCGN
eukprot:TRINITY_DN22591_c0_g1_i2.p1 TRINITY_DN22591_c0_g1~~TRINITY_DN22591_c0_g1_i2.p1  ORF type:complete len:180 (+),score=25.48 TRINITY_DN22591_c0_g1_i2:366-905(+)